MEIGKKTTYRSAGGIFRWRSGWVWCGETVTGLGDMGETHVGVPGCSVGPTGTGKYTDSVNNAMSNNLTMRRVVFNVLIM